jgi:hypothetical protein
LLGTFTATWVTSNLTSAQWTGAPTAPATRAATSGDQYQESSQWTLDGNDLEKSIYQCDIITICAKALDDNTPDSGNGLGARIRRAVDLYVSGRDKANAPLSDPFAKAFQLADYLDGIMTILSGEDSVTKPSPATLQGDLEDLCVDILNGQDSFTISQYVLRNTKTVPYTSSIIPAYAKVQRVWDTSDITALMTAETRAIDPPTSVVNFTLPLLGVLGSAIFSASKWLYRTPDVQQMNNGKWQITKEWWEGSQISVFTYQAYDAP